MNTNAITEHVIFIKEYILIFNKAIIAIILIIEKYNWHIYENYTDMIILKQNKHNIHKCYIDEI